MNELSPPRAREGAPSSGLDRALAVVSAAWSNLGAPGMTLAFVTPDGAVVQTSLGLADIDAGVSMPSDARMPGGSTGKSIFAATALSLAIAGRLELDLPLARYLGDREWFRDIPNGSALTLRHLLMHSGGLPDHMGDPDTLRYFVKMRREVGPDFTLDPESSVRRIARLPEVVQVGEGFFYSDTGYILAGLAIEAATGESLYDLARKHILQPHDLLDFEPAIRRTIARTVQGYTNASEASGLPARMILNDGRFAYTPASEWAGGGYVTSARDLARFIWLYASGRLTGEAAMGEAQKLVKYSWVENQIGGYGLGLFAADSPLGPTWGHGGYYPGYRSHMAYFPALDMSVAYQLNSAEAFTSYADIVSHRQKCATSAIEPEAPLTKVNDFAARLMMAFSGAVPA